MLLNLKKIIISSLIIFSFLCFFQIKTVQAGLVPCGLTSNKSDKCTLCHLFEGIQNIVNWGKTILLVVALVAIVAGAIMYIISAGNSGMMESAKGLIKQALWGVAIVLGAWVIVNTSLWLIASKLYTGTGTTNGSFMSIGSWYNFDCNGGGGSGVISTFDIIPLNSNGTCPTGYHVSSAGTQCVGDTPITTTPSNPTTPATPSTPTTNPVNTQGEDAVRDTLAAEGISINNPSACASGQTSGCTDVGGLRDNTLAGIIGFSDSCGSDCGVVITGGSEGNGIHSESGVYNHINGYKVDIRPNDKIDNYIETNPNFTKIPQPRSDGAIGYKDSTGNTYYREGDHWDITYF